MEPRFPHFVRADRLDPVRHWANLEGKSDSTRDDLYRDHGAADEHAADQQRYRFGAVLEIAAAVFELWRHGRS
jgi:hypothetical protein